MMNDTKRLYEEHKAQLEDFWGRRDDGPFQSRSFHVFGRAVELESNRVSVLSAVDYSLPLFSEVPSFTDLPFTIQVIARPLTTSGTAQIEEITRSITYVGQDDWITMHLGMWGMAHVNLLAGQAHVVIDDALAERPQLFSQAVLNTILLNFCLANGYAMLHASCLVRDGRVLLLIAPHNTGKSTTALHLIRAGFQLVSDSMVHVVPSDDVTTPPLLAGFPTRRIKLRGDMLDAFPAFRPHVQQELVRDETKHVLDLPQINPGFCINSAVEARTVTLCLLQRQPGVVTTWHAASKKAVLGAVMQNSLFYDSWRVWEANLRGIDRLLSGAKAYHLTIGRDVPAMLDAIEALWQN